jgi:hypothetical protein
MKNGIIFAHKSTWRSRLDLDYLDETSQRKITARETQNGKPEISAKLKQFADYASKETLGQVHAGGFLHDLIRVNANGTRVAPSKLTNDERKRRISESWCRHLRKFPTSSENPVIQHRLVFSMSAGLHDKLVASGINPDRVLHSTMKKAMTKFAERFHPDDAVGYACGVHHDTDNLHVHVALCPRTANGAYVGCSTSRTSFSGHQKQMDYLRACFERENKHWAQILSSPEKLTKNISQRLDADRLVFVPRLKRQQVNVLGCAQNCEAQQLQRLYRNILSFQQAIAERRAKFAPERDIRLVGRLVGHHPDKILRLVSKIDRAARRRSLRDLQQSLLKMKRQYRALHLRYSRIYGFHSYANRYSVSHCLSNQQQAAL